MVDATNNEVRSLNFFTGSIIGSGSNFTALSISFLFLAGVLVFASFHFASTEAGLLMIGAAVVGAYMALNIGANDVANNVGAAVGSRALTLGGAILIVGLFEAAGALLAGGDVVSTISKGIIDPNLVADSQTFVLVMVSALLAGGLWLSLATWIGAPVSTTHSIVGRFLEHSRIYYFRNGGGEEFYIGSADLMTRNLERRVEILAPVNADEARQALHDLFEVQLNDRGDVWQMAADGSYSKRKPIAGKGSTGCQDAMIVAAARRMAQSLTIADRGAPPRFSGYRNKFKHFHGR